MPTQPDAPTILIQFAHPYPHRSKINRALLAAVEKLEGVVVNDLYERYPDFYIDITREQDLLRRAELIVFQHPLYWYNAPAMLKHWLDTVLQYGFAYGREGRALKGKRLLSVVTTGHPEEDYRAEGYDRFTMTELLRPFERTAGHCGMVWEPPLVVYGARRITPEALLGHAEAYRQRLQAVLAPLGPLRR